MQPETPSLDPGLVGRNLVGARKRASLTQSQVAERVGISRATLVAIENGQRPPNGAVLVAIADALGVRVRDLVSLPPTDEEALVRFRGIVRTDDALRAAVDAIVDFGRYVVLIEGKAAKKPARRSVPTVTLDPDSDVNDAAEQLALAERARLNLGDGPIPRLRTVLEQSVGMFVFTIAELAKTKIAGLFTFANDIPLVGLNPAQRDARRACWTLAHEYAHFLTNRFDAEVTYPEGSRRSRDAYEVFADRFAAFFLMPTSGLTRRLLEVAGDKRNISVANILSLAAEFEVSFRAMCERLAELDRIPRDTYEYVMARGLRPMEAERQLGIKRDEEPFAPYPQRYLYLLSMLYRDGEISEGDAAAFLRTDRLNAREILESFGEPSDGWLDEPLVQLR
jgi:Zn-dependent peptidase ImmA (M78 family)/DNA-binding XRE family transcriptional regulator